MINPIIKKKKNSIQLLKHQNKYKITFFENFMSRHVDTFFVITFFFNTLYSITSTSKQI